MRDQALNLLKIGDRLGAKPLELSIKTEQPLFLSDLPDPYHLSLQFYFIPPVNTYLMGPKSQVDAVEKNVCGCTIAPQTADKIQRNLSHKYERAGGSGHKNECCRPILHMLRQPIEHISCSKTDMAFARVCLLRSHDLLSPALTSRFRGWYCMATDSSLNTA